MKKLTKNPRRLAATIAVSILFSLVAYQFKYHHLAHSIDRSWSAQQSGAYYIGIYPSVPEAQQAAIAKLIHLLRQNPGKAEFRVGWSVAFPQYDPGDEQFTYKRDHDTLEYVRGNQSANDECWHRVSPAVLATFIAKWRATPPTRQTLADIILDGAVMCSFG